jgi:Tol biopolymer transport system component/predicted Ser/Thr protein kinase
MTPNQTIAHYRIVSKLGEGGMGEVYRATDTKLGREVAIKILPAGFAQDPGRMARFEREAKVLASLNHPNIAAIYGVEERALVMELVEGESPKGPMPFEDAWKIMMQVADALEYAHEKGIIHRDLKPANVKVTPEGVVKLLDFGLAKAFSSEGETSGPGNAENSPTLTINATEVGVILGTAAYMAPEQAKGKRVDKRADVWSWGVMLYELLTGSRLFQGEDVADTLAQVLTKQPDLSRVPTNVRRLLKDCLEKDPKDRLRDIGDAPRLLEGEVPLAQAPAAKTRWPWLVAAIAVIIAVALAIALWRATRPVDHPLTRLTVDLGPDALPGHTTVAISPDGRRIVYPARSPNGKQALATRLLDQTEATLLPGTEGGSEPFFSPDSQWIGFFASGQIKKISVEGGTPVALYSAPNLFGASWGEDNRLVTAPAFRSPLWRTPASGGPAEPFTTLGPGEVSHWWPQVLPGGDAVLFTASSSTFAWDNATIEAISLKTHQVKIAQRGGYYGRYLPGGYLVYVHQGTLFGVKFDLAKLEVRSAPVPILEDVAANPSIGDGRFDFSNSGTFVYNAGKGPAAARQIDWLDSSGKLQPLISAPGLYFTPRFSPDGRKLAFTNGDIFIYDLDRDSTSRLTFNGNANVAVWAPDGKHLALASANNGFNISWVRSDGAGPVLNLLKSTGFVAPWSFSPDGSRLAYFEATPGGVWDLWTLPLDLSDPDHPKPGKPEPFVSAPANELLPMFSPDGRWIAYRSDESGTDEIYVRPFPNANGGKWQISIGGGLYALWSKDGRELFYESADNRIMVLDYSVQGSSFVPGKPRLWSDKQLFFPGLPNLDLAPDGKRFAVLAQPETSSSAGNSARVTFLFHFFDELKRKIP